MEAGSSPARPTRISQCSEMASPVFWEHEAQVRFLPLRPF